MARETGAWQGEEDVPVIDIWVIDGHIELTRICEAANWHRDTITEKPVDAGLPHGDARDYATFAIVDRKEPGHGERVLTAEQYGRVLPGEE